MSLEAQIGGMRRECESVRGPAVLASVRLRARNGIGGAFAEKASGNEHVNALAGDRGLRAIAVLAVEDCGAAVGTAAGPDPLADDRGGFCADR